MKEEESERRRHEEEREWDVEDSESKKEDKRASTESGLNMTYFLNSFSFLIMIKHIGHWLVIDASAGTKNCTEILQSS